MTDKTYKIYMTPLADEATYGDEIEISNFVSSANLSTIIKNTDSDDYTFGNYKIGFINLNCLNYRGEFNESDPRSIFPLKRDLAKVRVVYYDSLTSSSGSFKGIITDEGTKLNAENETITIKVLALESILKKVQVQAGKISTGDLFSDAIKSILDVSGITSVLTYDANEIDVFLDLTIDDASDFDGVSTWEALKLLLIASNSVVYIDDETIKVKTRDDNTGLVSYFYGPGDTLDRENIIKISAYNNGNHRIFNSVSVNDTLYTDSVSEGWFGLHQKKLTLSFMTDSTKETIIARTLVEQFRYPRFEFKMTCSTKLANEVDFFDTIGIDHQIRSIPYKNTDGSLWDTAKYNTANEVYPEDFGGVVIDGRLAFQIIERQENPARFETTLKMRGRGKTFDDGILIYWAAIWGLSRYDISTW